MKTTKKTLMSKKVNSKPVMPTSNLVKKATPLKKSK